MFNVATLYRLASALGLASFSVPVTQLAGLLDTGHFALEEDSAAIGALMRDFLGRTVK
ncbi:hypothetical protein IP91_02811 [Pseudoduganella lurida]|uniref:Uncharacterized protein n=1 Tax=Pseudoduganella lurida TaxID=1036180 RepID=A0A562R935_9BURK|nr:hypothetical protein [Pseudoduganella lurida]TWI65403.1 hypothetical protein IP91_02811 [Pseudoduganella lurida]